MEWPADAGLYTVVVPGQHETGLALPWGGTSHPVWFRRDPRVANVKVLGGVFNRALMMGVPQIVAGALEQIKDLSDAEKYAALSEQAAAVMNQMPPRENPRINTSLDSVYASGPLGRAHCVLHGNCNYKQTGALQAYAAYSLLQQPPRRAGFASGCQAFGHRELLGVLRSFGLVMEPPHGAALTRLGTAVRLTDFLDKGASLGPDAPCLTMAGQTRSYAEVQRLSWVIGQALARSGIRPGDKVAVLSANDPVAFSCVFGIARAGAVWCPVNPRNEAAENRELLDLFDCAALIFQGAFAPLVARIAADLPKVRTLVCLDQEVPGATRFEPG